MNADELAAYEQRLLLGGRWLPVTQEVEFFRADPDRCVEVLLDHYGATHLQRFGQLPESRVVHGDGVEVLLHRLLPIRWHEASAFLLLPTRNPEWTAMFSNRARGLGAGLGAAMGERGVEAVKVSEGPDGPRPPGWLAPVGYRGLTVTTPCAPWTNRRERVEHGVTRCVRVRMLETGPRVFETLCTRGGRFDEGIPGPVGLVWDADAAQAEDRFTHDHLRLASERLGLFPFDADFYAPGGWGVVVERTDPDVAGLSGLTLRQARVEDPR